MSSQRTRHSSATQLTEFVGCPKEFYLSDVPTLRAVIQRGLLIKERLYAENDEVFTTGRGLTTRICTELAPLITAQWRKANDKFRPPVTITEYSLVKRLERKWKKVDNVARDTAKKKDVTYITKILDKVLDITM